MKAPTRCTAVAAVLLVLSCHHAPVRPASRSVRLVDLYKPDHVKGTPPAAPPSERIEWRFDKDAAGWSAARGVAAMAVREGHLVGRSSDDLPILRVSRVPPKDDRDPVHAIEVRLRASAGANLQLLTDHEETLNLDRAAGMARGLGWLNTTPMIAGTEWRTYTVQPKWAITNREVRHLLIRPTDAKDATFELESVRVVLRREHLASVASGVGWQGLGGSFRESLVARSPEALTFEVEVPRPARLELELGTIEDAPVTFRVAATAQGRERVLLERTVTKAQRWEPVRVELGDLEGQRVSLSLSLRADKPGTLGIWGAPALRQPEATPRAARAGEPPLGVILIWADTLRSDHLGAYGYKRPTSPTLDRLAKEGALFKDCISPATWTKVATPSLLTSLYPASHGVYDFSDRIPSSAATLAEVYRAAGYATLSMSSVLFTGKFTNLHQGFETLWEDVSLSDRESSKSAAEYVDRLLPWLEGHRDTPFFAFLHVTDPHDPFKPRAPYDTLFADAARAAKQEEDTNKARGVIADPLLKLFGMPTQEELTKAGVDAQAYTAHNVDWYDGSIRGMDEEIRRVIERIDELGLRGRVLVVVAADHGEEFLEHGRSFHGQSVYGELGNVPLILWQPGTIPAGTVVEETVSMVDVMPTLLEMSRLTGPKEMQGRTLVAALRRKDSGAVHADPGTGRPAIIEKAVTQEKGGPPPRDTGALAIVAGGYKLVHHTVRPRGGPEFELFDHRTDPLDARDVAAAHPQVVERLRRELAAWKQMAEQARLKPDSEAAKGLSTEEMERLRSLGYLQ
jgi:arylsulfatase A-like enzyme